MWQEGEAVDEWRGEEEQPQECDPAEEEVDHEAPPQVVRSNGEAVAAEAPQEEQEEPADDTQYPEGACAEEEPWLECTLRSDRDSRFSTCSMVPGRSQVSSGAQDGSVFLWPLAPGFPRPTRLGCHRGPVTSVVASASGELIVSASVDATVMLWKNQAGRQVPAVIKVHFSPVRACDISRGERMLLSASDDKLVKLCLLPSRRFAASLVGHSNWVRTACFSPRSASSVVSGGDDKTVRLWDVERREALRTWYDCTGGVTCARFDADETAVAACSLDSTINIWDTRSQALRQHYARAHGNSSITQVAFHPSKELLLSCSSDRTLRVWDLRAGRLRSTVFGHEQPVQGCCWASDGGRMASCDVNAINIWALPGVGGSPSAASGQKLPLRGRRTASAVAALAPVPAPAAVGPGASGSAWLPSPSPVQAAGPGRPLSQPAPCGRQPQPPPLAELPPASQLDPDLDVTAPLAPPPRPPLGYGTVGLPAEAPAAAQPPPQLPPPPPAATGGSGLGDEVLQAAWGGRAAAAAGIDVVSARASAVVGAGGMTAAELPEALARTMECLVSQMEVLTQALQGLESRLSATEESVAEVVGMVKVRRQAVAAPAAVGVEQQGGSPLEPAFPKW